MSQVPDLRILPTGLFQPSLQAGAKGDYLDLKFPVTTERRVLQRFNDRHIRILEDSVLPDQRDGDSVKQPLLSARQFLPSLADAETFLHHSFG